MGSATASAVRLVGLGSPLSEPGALRPGHMRRHCRAKAVIKTMHELPIKDAIMRNPRLREDGRMVHDFYLMRVKTPEESKSPDDIYNVVATIKGDDAFKPLAESACPAIAK